MKELEELKKLIEGGSKLENIRDWERLKKLLEDAKEEFTEEERRAIERYLKLRYIILPTIDFWAEIIALPIVVYGTVVYFSLVYSWINNSLPAHLTTTGILLRFSPALIAGGIVMVLSIILYLYYYYQEVRARQALGSAISRMMQKDKDN